MYDIIEHKHRFATWTAAAASRQGEKITGYKNGVIREAIDKIKININAKEATMRDIASDAITQTQFCVNFDRHFANICNAYIEFIKGKIEVAIPFGKAAKAVSVYFKAMVICGGQEDSEFAKMLYPPIDRILLERLWVCRATFFQHNKDLINRFQHASRKGNFNVKSWSQLEPNEYHEIIKILKEAKNDNPLWEIERYWSL